MPNRVETILDRLHPYTASQMKRLKTSLSLLSATLTMCAAAWCCYHQVWWAVCLNGLSTMYWLTAALIYTIRGE